MHVAVAVIFSSISGEDFIGPQKCAFCPSPWKQFYGSFAAFFAHINRKELLLKINIVYA
jgi:hypothetical protein